MCGEIYDGAGAGICDGAPSTCSSLKLKLPVNTAYKILPAINIFHLIRCLNSS